MPSMQQCQLARRDFLRTAGTAAISVSAASYSRILGANDEVQLGVIGCGGRGVYVMETFQKTNRVNVGAVCDVYAQRIDRAMQRGGG